MDLSATLSQDSYALAPDLVLTAAGPQRDHVLVVDEATIAAVVPAAEFAGEALALPGRAVVPGFVDAHTHVCQGFGKAMVGGEPAQIWRRIWHPMEIAMDPEMAYVSAKWWFLEALRGGFTAVNNYGLYEAVKNEGIHRAAAETGIRLVSSCGLDEKADESGTGSVRSDLGAITARIEEHLAQVAPLPRVTPSVSCSSFIGNSPEMLTALSEICAERGVLLQIHANEHFPEVHQAVLTYGKRPIELLDSLGVLGPHVILHHTTLVAENEVEILARTRAAASYNPLASVWKGNAVAPAFHYAERGVRFGVGTDNTTADGFRTIAAAEACQRVAHAMRVADFSCGAGWTWVDAATVGAADASGLENVGRLARGMAADFLVLDMVRPECLPSVDFEWELVRYYNRDQVDAVVVDGAPVMLGGRPVGWDDRAFVAENLAVANRVIAAPGIERLHGVSSARRPAVSG